jgi:hypothetical protein
MAEAVTLHLPETVARHARATARRTGRPIEDVLTEWLEWVVTSEEATVPHAGLEYPLFTPYGNEAAAQALLDALASAELPESRLARDT